MRFKGPDGYIPRPKVHPVIDALRATRIANRITQSDLAEILGYHRRTIQHFEHAATRIDFKLVTDYADYFNLDVVLTPRETNDQL